MIEGNENRVKEKTTGTVLEVPSLQAVSLYHTAKQIDL